VNEIFVFELGMPSLLIEQPLIPATKFDPLKIIGPFGTLAHGYSLLKSCDCVYCTVTVYEEEELTTEEEKTEEIPKSELVRLV